MERYFFKNSLFYLLILILCFSQTQGQNIKKIDLSVEVSNVKYNGYVLYDSTLEYLDDSSAVLYIEYTDLNIVTLSFEAKSDKNLDTLLFDFGVMCPVCISYDYFSNRAVLQMLNDGQDFIQVIDTATTNLLVIEYSSGYFRNFNDGAFKYDIDFPSSKIVDTLRIADGDINAGAYNCYQSAHFSDINLKNGFTFELGKCNYSYYLTKEYSFMFKRDFQYKDLIPNKESNTFRFHYFLLPRVNQYPHFKPLVATSNWVTIPVLSD